MSCQDCKLAKNCEVMKKTIAQLDFFIGTYRKARKLEGFEFNANLVLQATKCGAYQKGILLPSKKLTIISKK